MQPLAPGSAGIPTIGALQGALPPAIVAPADPVPGAAPTDAVAPLDFDAMHQASTQAAAAKQAADDAKAAETEALRQKHGALVSGSGALLRGALDALLLGGTGVAVLAESAGALTGIESVEKFGRDLGKAATGESAMQALAVAFGDRDLADNTSRLLREQHEARPTLTTVSRMAGAAGVGLGLGGVSSGHVAAKAMIGANVLEGAGMGAQMAYEESAPLRDVLTSAAVGGLIGGASTAAVEGIMYGAKHLPDMSKVFGKVQRKADELAINAVTGRDAKVWNAIIDDPERVSRVAARTRDLIGETDPAKMIAKVDARAAEAMASEATLAKAFDEGLGGVPGIMGKVDDLIGSYKRSGVGDVKAIGDQLEKTVAPLRAKLMSEVADDAFETAGGMPLMRTVQRDPTFSELATFRRELNPTAKIAGEVTSDVADAHRSLLKLVSGQLDEAAGARGPSVARAWKDAARTADDFQIVSRAMERETIRQTKSPLVTGGDIQSGLTAALISAATAANPLAAIGWGIAGAAGRGVVNKVGGAAASKLMNAFARMGTRVSIRQAGGREMAEVMTALAKTKQFAAEMAESAGSNPAARQQAENVAMDIAAESLGKRAGKFNPETWHSAPLSPLQKVLYRGQILDKVTEDVATVAERTRALQPSMPDVLDVARIGKLTKDADGPAAIGGLMGKVDEIAGSVPPTPTGEAAAVSLRRAAQQLERADVPTAMARAHELASWLDVSADLAGDEGTKVFVQNAAREIRTQLGSDAFGEAGRQYRALATPVSTLDGLTDQAKLRAALAGLQGHGMLPQALKQAQDQIAMAHDAAAKLAGVPRPKTLAKDLEIGEDIFHAAEEALTLDGKAMERVFEVSQHVGIHEAAAPHAKANEMTVADAVDGELDRVVPILRNAAGGGTPTRYRPGRDAAAVASMAPLGIEAERERYKTRLETLTRLQSGGEDMGNLGEHPLIAADANDKMAALLRDMPKPPSTPLGPMGPDALSSDDLRLANAMWEATTEPLSVVGDLASGYIDPDKVAYAWKQYPGLQRACQAGIVDVLSNDLDDKERSALPENILTQLDSVFGFGGKLQETSDPFFAGRMSEIFTAEHQKRPPPPQGGMLKLPGAEPTFSQRLAGNV